MKSWWKTYQTKYHVQFFKCTVIDGPQEMKTKFEVLVAPTVIFYRDNKKVDRIDNFDESDPNISDTAMPGTESKDEKRVKARIEESAKPRSQ